MQENVEEHKRYGRLLFAVNESKTIGEKLIRGIPYSFAGIIYVVVNTIFINQGIVVLTIASITVIFGSPLIAILLPGKHKFYLYEAGVFIKSVLRSQLYRWDSFRNLTTDDDKNRFRLKISVGSIQLTSREHFDEVKQILSEHVSPKA